MRGASNGWDRFYAVRNPDGSPDLSNVVKVDTTWADVWRELGVPQKSDDLGPEWVEMNRDEYGAALRAEIARKIKQTQEVTIYDPWRIGLTHWVWAQLEDELAALRGELAELGAQ